jgi:hypothetical protein
VVPGVAPAPLVESHPADDEDEPHGEFPVDRAVDMDATAIGILTRNMNAGRRRPEPRSPMGRPGELGAHALAASTQVQTPGDTVVPARSSFQIGGGS